MYDDTAEILKPTIDAQKSIKESVDKKQDEVIDQLRSNQLAITRGMKDIKDATQDVITLRNELPFPFAVEGPEEKQQKITPLYKSNLDKGFTSDEIVRLLDYKAPPPSQILKSHIEGHINLDEYHKDIGEEIKSLGRQKGVLMKSKKLAGNNKDKIDDITKDIKLLQKYRDRVDLIRKGSETLGKGIYTQKKRNAYKIAQKGQYGGLVINLPKLHGHLKVVAHKNGKKVYDKQADFDTLDLLTKRFNSRKNYSQLARTVFNDLNKMSEIPIHKTSKKYSKL